MRSDLSNRIQAVIWDLGGVLVRTEDTAHRRIWEKRLGMKPWGLERLVHRNPIAQQATIGKASPDEVWSYVATALQLSENELSSLRTDFYAGDHVDPRLIGWIDELQATYKSGLITNAWSDVRRSIEKEWKIASVFDEIVISAEVGFAKPDPEIYLQMIERLDLPPVQTVFIDDFEENIQGANEAGMQTILFQSTKQIMNEFAERFRREIE